MPIGCYSLVPHIAADMCRLRPARVLDLGIGMGVYGAVVRQWLDMGVRPWRTTLHGVEAFAAYENPCWGLYDRIHNMSIEAYLARSAESWDAILLLDVLEHFERDQGMSLVEKLQERLVAGGRLYVGTPAVWMEQEAVYGNEFERHRSLWNAAWFLDRGFEVISDGSPDLFGNQMLLAVATRE